MPIRYCDFQPSQHKNKRPAQFVFLDDPTDKHPIPICDLCAAKVKTMLPGVIIRPMAEMKKEKAEAAAKETGETPPSA